MYRSYCHPRAFLVITALRCHPRVGEDLFFWRKKRRLIEISLGVSKALFSAFQELTHSGDHSVGLLWITYSFHPFGRPFGNPPFGGF